MEANKIHELSHYWPLYLENRLAWATTTILHCTTTIIWLLFLTQTHRFIYDCDDNNNSDYIFFSFWSLALNRFYGIARFSSLTHIRTQLQVSQRNSTKAAAKSKSWYTELVAKKCRCKMFYKRHPHTRIRWMHCFFGQEEIYYHCQIDWTLITNRTTFLQQYTLRIIRWSLKIYRLCSRSSPERTTHLICVGVVMLLFFLQNMYSSDSNDELYTLT